MYPLTTFQCYYFGQDVSVINDHKPLVSIFQKNVATLLARIQCTLLSLYGNNVQIMYIPDPGLHIVDCLSVQNCVENKYGDTSALKISIHVVRVVTDIYYMHVSRGH